MFFSEIWDTQTQGEKWRHALIHEKPFETILYGLSKTIQTLIKCKKPQYRDTLRWTNKKSTANLLDFRYMLHWSNTPLSFSRQFSIGQPGTLTVSLPKSKNTQTHCHNDSPTSPHLTYHQTQFMCIIKFRFCNFKQSPKGTYSFDV